MQIIDYNKRLFKNIFPDYDTFYQWYASSPLVEGESDIPSKKTFALISNEYNDCHVAYSPEGFKEHFANDLYTFSREFELTTKRISELMELTDKEISTENETISNFANIPENLYTTSDEEVNYISSQQKSINKKGLLQIKREQISNSRAFTVRTFLNRFRHLFITVLSPSHTFVVSEPEED